MCEASSAHLVCVGPIVWPLSKDDLQDSLLLKPETGHRVTQAFRPCISAPQDLSPHLFTSEICICALNSMSIYGYTEKNETQLETLRSYSLTGKIKHEELQIKSRMQSVPQGGTGQSELTSDLGSQSEAL